MAKEKTKHFRGSKTYGRGSTKKGRGAGERGGRGKTGLHKHKYLRALKMEKKGINVFGAHGFTPLKKAEDRVINIGELEERFQHSKKIDLTKLDYDKLLGAGKISGPVEVTVRSVTRLAKQKIETKGGKVIEG